MNVFEKALGIIQERGMTKYHLEDIYGRVCLYGALNLASTGRTLSTTDWRFREHLDRVVHSLFPDRGTRTPFYGEAAYINNHLDTTQEDVELILKHAAYEWDLLHPPSE
jgi:hypothetical protein